MSITSHKAELRDRIEASRKRLEARVAELRADGREQARAQLAWIEARMRELQGLIASGWDRLTEGAADQLENWLDRVTRNEVTTGRRGGAERDAGRADTLDQEAR